MQSQPQNFDAPPQFQVVQGQFGPPRSGKAGLIAAVIGGFVVLAICAVGLLAKVGLEATSAEVEEAVRDNKVMQANVGEIQDLKMDMSHSAAAKGQNTFVYKVKGTKGHGTLTVDQITNDEGREEILGATLRMASGKTYTVVEPKDAAKLAH